VLRLGKPADHFFDEMKMGCADADLISNIGLHWVAASTAAAQASRGEGQAISKLIAQGGVT